ncbi:type II CRISPR RNA-guided endonuclease Cas9 [Helicobacter muridarum]|uniref:CRISPR-associated endonuclease Cas9 n=1 Tax=Helicobacter muridarum TaxID=216 RepID=A0A377PUI4_9HELI|nr:type II CRISPR RNA-guided endonuclease Cas9 [Helicobacter muridarum]TLE01089.1 type II CRISPR RNA-guided endonuclease Cas9 [Helicobacter muridarum]STQ85951.1 CRISPR-associated protein [Helicobacter muridarum]
MKKLAFDIGIASIGWAFVEDDELRDCGVRIFTKAENPKNGKSLALPRREARAVRRRLARRKTRLNSLKRLLCKELGFNLNDYLSNDGVLPKAYETNKDTKSPYELRTLALSQKLDSKDFARVVLHIAKHRGYGNKHAKIGSDKDSGKVLSAIKANKQAMEDKEYKSVGEYLYNEFYQKQRLESEKKVSNHASEFKNVRNKGKSYEHCVAQEQLKAELELIFKRQREFGVSLSKEFEDKVIDIAFFQLPLKDFSDKVGECVFCEGQKRAPKDSLSAMEFVALTRIINTLRNLEKRISNKTYSKEKVQEILQIVLDKGEISYKKLREILSLPDYVRFSDSKLDYTKELKEVEKAKFIELKNLKAFKKALGRSFDEFSRDSLDKIAEAIALNKSRENLKKELEKNFAQILRQEQKEALSDLSFAKHIDLSLKALNEILPFMRGESSNECLRYDEAVERAGLKEIAKNKEQGNFLLALKEYEPYLANPVVARALSEYRKVLNALLRKYGQVHKIHLEFTREVNLSHEERKKVEKEQQANFTKNQEAEKLCKEIGLHISKDSILKAKLFIEQGEFCAYSCYKITSDHLKDPNMLQIDHIYPYSRSFDDSYMNKVLVFNKENQNKGNRTPFEAFGSDKDKWEKILSLADRLPKAKRKRIYNKDFKDKEAGFILRNIVDTGYIARLASQWTKHCLKFLPLSENEVTIAGEKGSKVHVEIISGKLTSMLRHYWGLGNKDRSNHLHHAVDAIIIAYASAKTIKAFADFRANQDKNTAEFYAEQISELEYVEKRAFFNPCKNFRKKVLEKLNSIFVSKPPRKRARGALHEETFYSFDDKNLLKSYGGEKGIQKAIELGKIRQIGTKIVSNGTMVRVDIFKDKKGKFYGVPIYTMDFALGILPNKAVVGGKDKEGVIKDWKEMDSNYEFCFSIFKDDLILVQKNEMEEAELCYYKRFKTSGASIEVVKHDNRVDNITENQEKIFKLKFDNGKKILDESLIAIQNLKIFEKYQVSPLGEVQKAEFIPRQSISLKSTPNKNKLNKVNEVKS